MKLASLLLPVALFLGPEVLLADDPSAPKPASAQLEHFEKVIRPLLARRCFSCHSKSAKKLKAGLRLDSRKRALAGGETGPALVPGDPDKSLLVQAIRYSGDYKMPPSGKLPPEEIRTLTEWIRGGAAWPDDGRDTVDPAAPFDLAARRKAHWAWQPVRVVEPRELPEGTPEKLVSWALSPVDRYVLDKLLARKLAPAGDADRVTWLRRVTYDLSGMPPLAADLDAFVADATEMAHEKVVDRLLGSTQFGEHWARHWLDLVRFAESRGHESDYVAPNAWEYRDYVIRALNTDVAYDLFLVEHVAGDLLPRPRRHPQKGFNESMLGTGFWHMGDWCHSPVDLRQDEADRHDNMLDVFSKTFLGLTVSCARCHDHKFDAISQNDYYALSGFLKSSGFRLVRYETIDHNRQVAVDLAVLRAGSRRALYAALTTELKRGLPDLPAYLLSAREVIAAGAPDDAAARVAAANRRKLGVQRLGRIITHLVAAEKTPDDPLHAWSKLCRLPEGEPTAEALAGVLDPLRKNWAQRQAAAGKALEQARPLVDFRRLEGRRWRQDGASFRTGPVEPGDLVTSADPSRPILKVFTRGGAAWDRAFSGLAVAPGSENENGKLSGWIRAGRTIRTPTFSMKTGRLWFLVAGGGHAFASVNSHRLLHGPLHGRTVINWDAGNNRPRWVHQDLSRMAGHEAHIEFSTRGDKPLQVFLVVESDQSPGDPFAGDRVAAVAAVTAGLGLKEAATLETTAAALGKLFETAVAWSRNRTKNDAPAQAEVLAWLVSHVPLLAADPKAARDNVSKATRDVLAREQRLIGSIKKSSRLAMAMWDGSAQNQSLFVRGNSKQPGPEVPRRMLEALGGKPIGVTEPGSGRLSLAVELVRGRNPLVARVLVNRLWHHLFGRGLVPTVDNFGIQGQPPSHPELLDWLADRFSRERWSIKTMIRRLVLSRTYRMSSRAGELARSVDPTNVWLHSTRVRRLQGEAIRDALLSVSGRLDRAYLGKSVPIFLSPHMIGRGRPKSGPMDGNGRRTIYIGVRRNFLSSMMLAFDTPQPFSTVGRRTKSNVPAQALILMNDPFVVAQAGLWAKRLLAQQKLDTPGRIKSMYRQAFGRRPSEQEVAAASGFLVEQGRRYGLNNDEGTADPRVWSDLCHVMFNAKEFIYIN
jgi:hypothetical protein